MKNEELNRDFKTKKTFYSAIANQTSHSNQQIGQFGQVISWVNKKSFCLY